ncbi:hypothetical protein AVEN_197364-1, partial [Araneus ventricosus]
MYVLKNARVCGRLFSESCFNSTLRQRLIKFACPDITLDLSSTESDTLSALPSAAFQCSSVEVCNAEPLSSESIMDVEPSCSENFMDAEPSCSESFLSSPTSSHNTSAHLQKICACRKLTKRHIEVSGLKKMNVKLTTQVLSHSVAAALDLYVGREDFDS